MNTPKVNLGQSVFQDTYMVTGSVFEPYRKLRTIELQIKDLKDSLKTAEFNLRKSDVKLKNLDPKNELDAIEIEEIEYSKEGSKDLIYDSLERLLNYENLKKELIDSVDEEYWNAGFEAAEEKHWIGYYSKKMAIEMITTGHIGQGTLEQIAVLPNKMITLILTDASENRGILTGKFKEADDLFTKRIEEQNKLADNR